MITGIIYRIWLDATAFRTGGREREATKAAIKACAANWRFVCKADINSSLKIHRPPS